LNLGTSLTIPLLETGPELNGTLNGGSSLLQIGGSVSGTVGILQQILAQLNGTLLEIKL